MKKRRTIRKNHIHGGGCFDFCRRCLPCGPGRAATSSGSTSASARPLGQAQYCTPHTIITENPAALGATGRRATTGRAASPNKCSRAAEKREKRQKERRYKKVAAKRALSQPGGYKRKRSKLSKRLKKKRRTIKKRR
jgi:hypothetical protein